MLILIIGKSIIIPLILSVIIWFLIKEIREFMEKSQWVKTKIRRWIKTVVATGFIIFILGLASNLLIYNINNIRGEHQDIRQKSIFKNKDQGVVNFDSYSIPKDEQTLFIKEKIEEVKSSWSINDNNKLTCMVLRNKNLTELCGFYDEAGEFTFRVGLPGKSGVGGGIVAIHPNEYSVAVWGPKLNPKGNSAIGMTALELLTTKTGYSIF